MIPASPSASRRSERIRARAAEGLGASTVRVCDPEQLTCLAREVDHFVIVHPAHLARRHDDVAERDLLKRSLRPLHALLPIGARGYLDPLNGAAWQRRGHRRL